MTAVGFVGLGAMGSRVAGRLLATGHQVHRDIAVVYEVLAEMAGQ
jgi:3-hydroxyisobutyrate dehydrogenase-like beta-hydroxyacid dehydrogenase